MTRTIGASIRFGILATALTAWFTSTAVKQDPARKVTMFDGLDGKGIVLPEWRFFAPNPGVHDTHLLTRDELDDGSLTPWKECFPATRRRARHCIWYPDRRAEKVVLDAVAEAVRAFNEEALAKKEDAQVTVTYLVLLNYVTHSRPHPANAVRTQFLIARSNGYEQDEPILLFLSNMHPLR